MTSDADTDPGLRVSNLGKTYHGAHKPLFTDLNFDLGRSGRLAILGRNGQGKSTLIKMLGGVMPPSEGSISWRMTSSWPIGFGGGFQGSLSGLDNVRFLARLYGREYKETLERVDEFAALGQALRDPVNRYCSVLTARPAVGDARFQRQCQEGLFEERAHRAFLMASHDVQMIANYCDRALIIESGRAKIFHDIQEAVEVYTWLRAA